MDPKGKVGRIYKEEHYTLIQTKYESFGFCGFGEEDLLKFFPMTPKPPPPPHYTLLHTKYESFGFCGFGEEDFF